MEWIRLNTAYPQHKKLRRLIETHGPEAAWRHLGLLTYCGQVSNNGHLDHDEIRCLGVTDDELTRLVELHLLDRVEGQPSRYQMHNWERYHGARATIEADEAKRTRQRHLAAERQRRHRAKLAKQAVDNPTSRVTEGGNPRVTVTQFERDTQRDSNAPVTPVTRDSQQNETPANTPETHDVTRDTERDASRARPRVRQTRDFPPQGEVSLVGETSTEHTTTSTPSAPLVGGGPAAPDTRTHVPVSRLTGGELAAAGDVVGRVVELRKQSAAQAGARRLTRCVGCGGPSMVGAFCAACLEARGPGGTEPAA